MTIRIDVLDKGFLELVDHMGDDNFICTAARTSYGRDSVWDQLLEDTRKQIFQQHYGDTLIVRDISEPSSTGQFEICIYDEAIGKESFYIRTIDISTQHVWKEYYAEVHKLKTDNHRLIRRLMRDYHTSPFEMVEFVFCAQVPMDCWRQWIRHRTASVNEYSTRYSEALDFAQQTSPEEWRLQSGSNKQGSDGLLKEWPEGTATKDEYCSDNEGLPTSCYEITLPCGRKLVTQTMSPGEHLSSREQQLQALAREVYEERLALGVAREQARKDLPLSTYTRAYWKCDLHNIFNFLRLRMDPHAQLEIRQYANAMAQLVKTVCPMAYQAFEDYRLNAMQLSAAEIAVVRRMNNSMEPREKIISEEIPNKTEAEACEKKLHNIGFL